MAYWQKGCNGWMDGCKHNKVNKKTKDECPLLACIVHMKIKK
jgi:hypothetical protein